jgi:hypothetical protein
VIWDDPALAIPWQIPLANALLSDKDVVLPCLGGCPVAFGLPPCG